MTREQVLAISDALAELGQSHSITVSVHDGFAPRENYSVNVTPVECPACDVPRPNGHVDVPALTFSPTDITALQRLGDKLGYGIAYVAGSFTFTGAERD